MPSRRALLSLPAPVLLLAVGALVGCTRTNPDYCERESDCTGGRVCVLQWKACVLPEVVPALDGGSAPLDGPSGLPDVPMGDDAAPPPIDASSSEAGPGIDGTALDGAGASMIDAAGTCGVDGDCPDPTQAFCVAGQCVGCQGAGTAACGARVCDASSGRCVECTADGQCGKDPARPFCVANVCAACTTTGATGCATRTDGKTVCATSGTAAGQCVECVADGECGKDPAKAFCVANVCSSCYAAGPAGCGSRTDGKAMCASDGPFAGRCVECLTDRQCTKDPARAFCVANACTGCDASGATGCAGRTDGKTVCATDGTAAGQCVECTGDDQCTKDASQSFCVANACAGCKAAPADACSERSPTKPVCGTAGNCVECNTAADCAMTTKPICTAGVCGACTADSQCASKLGTSGNPGVCMSHLDGHCATDAETIYVGAGSDATCSEANPGTAQEPVCSVQGGVGLAKSGGKPLVVVRGTPTAHSTTITTASPLTIVGKDSATLSPAAAGEDGMIITSGTIYLRDLIIQGSSNPATGIGIIATPTSGSNVTLHMERCKVVDNGRGGIRLNGAGFDIINTTVSGNEGDTAGTQWAGIFVEHLPTEGPTSLNLVTIKNNNGGGLTCTDGPIQGSGVLVTGNTNTLTQISDSCGVVSCTPGGGVACGAQ